MKHSSIICAAIVLGCATGFGAASAADAGVASPASGQYRGPEAQSELPNALKRIAASPKDYDALVKAIIGKDERSTRTILTRYHYVPSAPYKVNFVASSLNAEKVYPDVVYFAVRQPGRFYGDPTPGWVGYVYIHGKGWYDMRTDTYIKSNEW